MSKLKSLYDSVREIPPTIPPLSKNYRTNSSAYKLIAGSKAGRASSDNDYRILIHCSGMIYPKLKPQSGQAVSVVGKECPQAGQHASPASGLKTESALG